MRTAMPPEIASPCESCRHVLGEHDDRGPCTIPRCSCLMHHLDRLEERRAKIRQRVALDVASMLSVWGLSPITRVAWAFRCKPDASEEASARAWERLKVDMDTCGVPFVREEDASEHYAAIRLRREAKAWTDRALVLVDHAPEQETLFEDVVA